MALVPAALQKIFEIVYDIAEILLDVTYSIIIPHIIDMMNKEIWLV